ncbi:hypothetical protein BU25DRAFT_412212 [Macroventuria anomochaeta]|uniref:Uncharacterized protein n=1 Tax=Macroventuria anomochaeta TaxID=301207 RepID=A0ACB6RW88_9PLEO|nr:uncharacterized protein BU25DRAFT_412212 [Macroventuria anomochaeta]KAF2625967.1 hypothetical protein BU25DRAFT_412212 [Macroventuria anomochaeta]
MTGRRSARADAKAPVKYTSDSDDSNFGAKKRRSQPRRPMSPLLRRELSVLNRLMAKPRKHPSVARGYLRPLHLSMQKGAILL